MRSVLPVRIVGAALASIAFLLVSASAFAGSLAITFRDAGPLKQLVVGWDISGLPENSWSTTLVLVPLKSPDAMSQEDLYSGTGLYDPAGEAVFWHLDPGKWEARVYYSDSEHPSPVLFLRQAFGVGPDSFAVDIAAGSAMLSAPATVQANASIAVDYDVSGLPEGMSQVDLVLRARDGAPYDGSDERGKWSRGLFEPQGHWDMGYWPVGEYSAEIWVRPPSQVGYILVGAKPIDVVPATTAAGALDAIQLASELAQMGGLAFEAKYRNQDLVVEGSLRELRDYNSKFAVALGTPVGAAGQGLSVECMMLRADDYALAQAVALRVGDEVVFTGRLDSTDDYTKTVTLDPCVLGRPTAQPAATTEPLPPKPPQPETPVAVDEPPAPEEPATPAVDPAVAPPPGAYSCGTSRFALAADGSYTDTAGGSGRWVHDPASHAVAFAGGGFSGTVVGAYRAPAADGAPTIALSFTNGSALPIECTWSPP
jgi:hypothetical protein